MWKWSAKNDAKTLSFFESFMLLNRFIQKSSKRQKNKNYFAFDYKCGSRSGTVYIKKPQHPRHFPTASKYSWEFHAKVLESWDSFFWLSQNSVNVDFGNLILLREYFSQASKKSSIPVDGLKKRIETDISGFFIIVIIG